MKKEMKQKEHPAAEQSPAQKRPLGWLLSPTSVMQHPPGVLLTDAIVFVLLVLVTLIVNRYLAGLNSATFLFVRWGSVLLLVLAIATFIFTLKMLAHVLHAVSKLRNPYKFAIFALVVIAAVYVFIRQDYYVPRFLEFLSRIPWGNLNPIAVSLQPYL